MDWMMMPLRRYAEFSGRSRRKEYWMFVLMLVIVGVVLGFIEGMLGLNNMFAVYGPLSLLFFLATLVPSLAVTARRLHDTNRSGWWMLISVIPYAGMAAAMTTGSIALMGILGIAALAGAVVLLVFMVLDGTKGPNQYGEDPKAGEATHAPA